MARTALPARHLATKAARKSAPADRGEDCGSEKEGGSAEESGSAEEDDSSQEDQTGSPVVLTEGAQRQLLFIKLLSTLCSPSDEKYGTFAASEVIPPSQEGSILESMYVDGAGELRLPLSSKVIAKLRSVGEQSSFGSQVDLSKVTFLGTPEFISKTVQLWALKAVRELGRYGVAVQLEARRDKLLLFERDGHFKFYGGKEKAKGIFATFIIQFPTEDGYKDSYLVVHHNESTKTFDWLNRISKVGLCYSVFFGDCKHELRRIISGTRVCLVFDLVRLDPSSDEALRQALISSKVREAEAALQPWLQDVMEENQFFGKKLAIPSEHRYKERKLTFAGLKGDDNVMAEVLKSCRSKNGDGLLDLHFCLVTKHQEGNYVEVDERDKFNYGDDSSSEDSVDDNAKDHTMREVSREKISIKGWIGLDDMQSMAFQKLQMDMKREVVVGEGKEPFRAEPDAAKYRREKLESGDTLECWFHRAMILVWPKDISSSLACETSVPGDLHLHQIVYYCENNASKVWEHGIDQVFNQGNFEVRDHGKFDSVTPQLLHLCIRASMVDDLVLVLKLLAKTNSDVSNRYGLRVKPFKIGVRNVKVATGIAPVVQVCGWEMFSSQIIELLKGCALYQAQLLLNWQRSLYLWISMMLELLSLTK